MKIPNYLKNPLTNKAILNDDDLNYFNGILDLFIEDNNLLTNVQSDFYNEVMFPNYDNIDNFSSLLYKSQKSIFAKKLDQEIPFGSRVLEAGCGTGQLSISLSRFNRQITGIDLSKNSLIEAKKFIDLNGITSVDLIRMNIFKMFFYDEYFDVVISNGVLHHTHNPRLAFSKLCNVLKNHGLIVIGLYHSYGRIIHNIRQFFIKIFGKNLIKIIDRRLTENISEKKKYAWLLDQYYNPSETKHNFFQVLDWFKENKIEYISSIPFDFDANTKIFEKKNISNKLSYFIKEFSMIFDSRQIYEGGFFVMIGRKVS
jgi:ubiquinone/menaquinone biosynthesis C-methylase UbiE